MNRATCKCSKFPKVRARNFCNRDATNLDPRQFLGPNQSKICILNNRNLEEYFLPGDFPGTKARHFYFFTKLS